MVGDSRGDQGAGSCVCAHGDFRKPDDARRTVVDYHLDHGNGIDAIAALRRRYGDLPAILITADRSPAVREQARKEGIQVCPRPIKPAALRALLAQWRVLRVQPQNKTKVLSLPQQRYAALTRFNLGSGDHGLCAALDTEFL